MTALKPWVSFEQQFAVLKARGMYVDDAAALSIGAFDSWQSGDVWRQK